MPLAKSADLLKKLDLALTFDKNPLKTARRYSNEGMQNSLRTTLKHPWLGLVMLADAYQDKEILRRVTEAGRAMSLLANALEKRPPAQWRKMLLDPTRQEQGYSIDTLYVGGCIPIEPEGARKMIREKLAEDVAPKKAKKPEPQRKPLDTIDAYILPDGQLVHVGFQGHINYADSQGLKTDEPDKLGWIKITSGCVWIYGEPSVKQMRKLEEWCKFNKKEFDIIEAGLRDNRDFHIFFDRS